MITEISKDSTNIWAPYICQKYFGICELLFGSHSFLCLHVLVLTGCFVSFQISTLKNDKRVNVTFTGVSVLFV